MDAQLQALIAQANEYAEESGIDMNEAKQGGGGRLLPTGYAFAQLVEYVEYGTQPQEFQGVASDPAPEFQLGFALSGTAPNGETFHDAATGAPYLIRPYSQKLSQNPKSASFKLFKLLNWKGDKKSFAQFLSQKFLVKVVHVPKSKTDQTKVSRLDLTSFIPPLDPVTQQPYAVPDAPASLYKLFLWNKPTLQAWGSLFVEGKFDDGASKNRVQETILGAVDFEGSPLQALLLAGNVAYTVPPKKAPASPVAAPQLAAPTQVATPVVKAPAAPVVAPVVPVVAPVLAAPVIAAPVVPVAPVLPA